MSGVILSVLAVAPKGHQEVIDVALALLLSTNQSGLHSGLVLWHPQWEPYKKDRKRTWTTCGNLTDLTLQTVVLGGIPLILIIWAVRPARTYRHLQFISWLESISKQSYMWSGRQVPRWSILRKNLCYTQGRWTGIMRIALTALKVEDKLLVVVPWKGWWQVKIHKYQFNIICCYLNIHNKLIVILAPWQVPLC